MIDYQQTIKAALILRGLNHDLRYRILKLTDEYQGAYPTQIYKKLEIEHSVASQQLAILRDTGLVNTIRDGKTIYYIPDYIRINEIIQAVARMVEYKV